MVAEEIVLWVHCPLRQHLGHDRSPLVDAVMQLLQDLWLDVSAINTHLALGPTLHFTPAFPTETEQFGRDPARQLRRERIHDLDRTSLGQLGD